MHIPTNLTDPQLLAALKRAARDERGATASLVAHLAEMDARTLHLGLGFSSLFEYCLEERRLSESATCKRIEVARSARRFPVLLDRLAEGALSLSSARLLAPKLTGENHRELIAAASGLRKRAVEEMLARRFPKPDVATLVRKLPTRTPAQAALEMSDGPANEVAPVPLPATPLHPLHMFRRPHHVRWRRPCRSIATRSGSRPVRRRGRSCRSRGTCCATRFPAAMRARSSTGH